MEMHFDMESRLATLLAGTAGNHAPASLDWHGLHARMAAAYAARPAIALANPQESVIDGGSFDRGSARVLADFGETAANGLAVVNPTVLATGNSECDKDAAVAGACSVGERG